MTSDISGKEQHVLFVKKFLIAITRLYQTQIKSRFRGNLDEDPGPLKVGVHLTICISRIPYTRAQNKALVGANVGVRVRVIVRNKG